MSVSTYIRTDFTVPFIISQIPFFFSMEKPENNQLEVPGEVDHQKVALGCGKGVELRGQNVFKNGPLRREERIKIMKVIK